MQDDFDQALQGANIGRRYQTNHKWLMDLALVVPACVEGILQPLRDARPVPGVDTRTIPDVLSGVNDSPAFNAFAFEHRGHYALAINYGVLILVQDLTNRLFCLPELFPWVGNPAMEDPNRPFHPTTSDAMEYMRRFIAEPRQVVPKDPTRRDAAKLLLVAALEFIVCHELWHILGGHLRWHTHRTTELSLAEVRSQTCPTEGIAYQALEMDADAFAVWCSLLRTLALAAGPHDEGDLSRVIMTPGQAVEVTFICAVVMVGTFLGEMSDPSAWTSLSHPPVGVRHGMNMAAADRTLRHLGEHEAVTRMTGNKAWVARFGRFILDHVWKRIGNPERHQDFRLSFGPMGVKHMTALMRKLGGLKPELNRFAHVAPQPPG